MKLLKVLLGLALAFCLVQAKDAAKENPVLTIWKEQIKVAQAEINMITPAELMEWNKSDKKFVLVDVREPNEVEAGWIEANTIKKIPRGTLDAVVAKAGALSPDQTVVMYCKKGARGALAGKMLKDLGFKNVYNLKGGIHGWMEAGQPIVSSLGTFKTVPYELTGCGD